MLSLLLTVAGLLVLLLTVGGALGLVTLQVTKTLYGYFAGNSTVTITDLHGETANPTVPVAQPGVLTTHSTNTTGTMTMTNALHGITTGQRIDIYWSGGQCYGAVAGTVSGTSVPIASVSGGSNLPASSTAVVVGIATVAVFNVVGNNLSALAATPGLGQDGYIVFNDGTNDDLALYIPNSGTNGGLYEWDNSQGSASPLATYTITKVYMSHDNTAAAVTSMTAIALSH